MPDYQGNSHKAKTQATTPPPEKKLERVVVGEVIIQKKSIGSRVKGIFLEADLKTVIRSVTMDTVIPMAKNLIVDSLKGGVDQMFYGERAVRRRNTNQGGPRIQYHNPTSLGVPYSPSNTILGRVAPAVSSEPRQQTQRFAEDVVILQSKDEAEMVIERMQDALDQYQIVSLSDFKALIGSPQTHVDNKWGWTFLGGACVRQVREGFLLDLPPVEPI